MQGEKGDRRCYTGEGEGWWCRMWREISLSLILGRLTKFLRSTCTGWVWSGIFSPSPEPFAEGVSCPSALSRITGGPPLSLSWGAWKDLSPLPQGNRLQRVGVGIGIRGQELGHESNAAAAEAESGTPQRQKTAPLGTHGDFELGSSTKGLILGPSGALLLQTLQRVCFFLGAALRCSGPPSPTCWAAHQLLPIKTFPFKTLSALRRQGQGQA